VDPAGDPELRGKAIPIVYTASEPVKNEARAAGAGTVVRDCSDLLGVVHHEENKFFVRKRPRQGAFDNLHLAPRMKVAVPIDRAFFKGIAGGHAGEAKFTSLRDWKMDDVVMAPLCAHDCLHMHWRWSDNENEEHATFGFKDGIPNKAPGAVMIPGNQAAFIVIHSPSSASYLAHVVLPNPDEWQCIFHHGAGYGLSSGTQVMLGKIFMRALSGTSFFASTTPVNPLDWALYYWTNRFTLNKNAAGTVEVVERFSFVSPGSRAKVLAL
jgi:hypothetical protein